jgi:energy-coupling factor transport system ATP-binding protein
VLELLAAVPLAVLAQRHRARAIVAGALAGSVVAFVVGGVGAGAAVLACAVMGGVVGSVSRRGRGWKTVLALSFVIGPLCGAAAVALLWVLSAARELAFGALRSAVGGAAGVLDALPVAGALAGFVSRSVDVVLGVWWLCVFLGVTAFMPVGMLSVWKVLSLVLARVNWVIVDDALDDGCRRVAAASGPLPLELRAVRYRYPGAGAEALNGIDLSLAEREFVVITGPNGSGKSTLVKVLAGARPTTGQVIRPGAPGLGEVGGTALITQRPEVQVLGMTVSEDLAWGLPPGFAADAVGVLEAVGLAGLEERATSSLSGGQLQRLAVAAALVRKPALLISDESTAMVDAEGRQALLELLEDLPRNFPVTVVHVSHSEVESARADRVIHLVGGRIVSDGSSVPTRYTATRGSSTPTVVPEPAPAPSGLTPVLEVRDVAHTYAPGTPWAHEAVRPVSFDLHEGEGLLITGENGSGKSTLAWILAGLLRPEHGVCTLDGVPVQDRQGSVALAFQHSRLQVQRPTVALDILAAAGRPVGRRAGITVADSTFVAAALDAVGLPATLASTSIEELSGGQLRRVALAGLISRKPRVLVLDEPLAGLDPVSRQQLGETLAGLRARDGLSLVVISHDLEGLETACPRRLHLDQGVQEWAE